MPQIPKQLSGWHELQKKEWVVGSAGLQRDGVMGWWFGISRGATYPYLYIDTSLCVHRWQCNHIISSIYIYIHIYWNIYIYNYICDCIYIYVTYIAMCFRIERAREKYCIQWPWGANIEAKSLRKRTVKLHLGAMSGAVGGCVWVTCAAVSDTQPTMFSYLARVIFASFLICYSSRCMSFIVYFFSRHDLSMQRQFHWMPVYGCTSH